MLTLVKVIASIGHFLIQDPSLKWLVACLARLVSELVKYLCDSVIGLVGDFCHLVEYLGDSVIGLVKCLGDSVIGLVECLGDSVIGLVGDFCHLVEYLGDSVIGQVGEFCRLVEYLGDFVISLVRCLCDLVEVSSFSFPSLLATPLNSAFIRQLVITLAVVTAISLAFVFFISLDGDERRQTLRYLGVRMMGAGAEGEGP